MTTSMKARSKYAIYRITNPKATYDDFFLETGGTRKQWHNASRALGKTDIVMPKGKRKIRSPGVMFMMLNPNATHDEYVKAGFPDEKYKHHKHSAKVHLETAKIKVKRLPVKRVAKVAVKAEPKPVEKRVEMEAPVVQLAEPFLGEDRISLTSAINKAVSKLMAFSSAQEAHYKAEISTLKLRMAQLCADNAYLRREVTELTEMINGPTSVAV